MDDLAWSDLDTDEQRAIAMLAQGISPDFCDAVALLTLRRIGLIKGSRLTFAAEEMLSSAIRSQFSETAKPRTSADTVSV
jgi:hypothetical protein